MTDRAADTGAAGGRRGPLILAVDQGTSASKAVLTDPESTVLASAGAPLAAAYPRPGWVEQSAEEIWRSVTAAVRDCLAGHDPAAVAAVGLSTQRESVLLWDRVTGEPVGPLLGWQDRRTADVCARLLADGAGPGVRAATGLPLDPMFSALKAKWLLDTYDPDRTRARRGELCLGTVDSWLLWRLGGGAEHVIEVGNAARTQLLDIRRRDWDEALLALFGVPRAALPRVAASTGPFPSVRGVPPLVDGTPVGAVLGDSHAALLGHGVLAPGRVKATYGTGSSVMGLVASPEAPGAGDALCLTIAWDDSTIAWDGSGTDGGVPAYALEGNIRSSGATLRWLAGLVGRTEAELATAAAPDSGGVHLVPAFGGLAAPWWDNDATGLISGLTLGTGTPELARAALESIAFQVEDVVAAVDRAGDRVAVVLADGGPSGNPVLMRLQADLSGRTVERPRTGGLSALGAARLAARSAGLVGRERLAALPRDAEVYPPTLPEPERLRRLADWHDAVARSRGAGKVPTS
ncbi:FGGY family carbohydrate kinase [Streptomyces blattellae]|uniref:FGGY family carbohydrate kinase n=1 Tax=Streptomyces blattellae TaxID=2569855 RepID=UPI0012B7A735|nr:FGGY family carbohydrate kinase [Streptomyces blattellae]